MFLYFFDEAPGIALIKAKSWNRPLRTKMGLNVVPKAHKEALHQNYPSSETIKLDMAPRKARQIAHLQSPVYLKTLGKR
jgi:hypothetical protein